MARIDRRLFVYFDWVSLGITFFLGAVGLAFVYSATCTELVPCSLFFKKQLFGFISGIVLYTLFCVTDFRKTVRVGYFFYFAIMALLLFTLIKGKIGMGAQRWIDLKILRFQ